MTLVAAFRCSIRLAGPGLDSETRECAKLPPFLGPSHPKPFTAPRVSTRRTLIPRTLLFLSSPHLFTKVT